MAETWRYSSFVSCTCICMFLFSFSPCQCGIAHLMPCLCLTEFPVPNHRQLLWCPHPDGKYLMQSLFKVCWYYLTLSQLHMFPFYSTHSAPAQMLHFFSPRSAFYLWDKGDIKPTPLCCFFLTLIYGDFTRNSNWHAKCLMLSREVMKY